MSGKKAPSPWSYIRKLSPTPTGRLMQARWPYVASLAILSAMLISLVVVERMISRPAPPAEPAQMDQAMPGGAPDAADLLGFELDAALPAAFAGRAQPAPQRPVPGRVSKPYGWGANATLGDYRFHTGVDLAARLGESVRAWLPGRVTYAATNDETGLTVLVEQSDGSTALYGNLGTLSVHEGDQVKAGEAVGTVGSTAAEESADPPHLHFEMLASSEPVDPGLR